MRRVSNCNDCRFPSRQLQRVSMAGVTLNTKQAYMYRATRWCMGSGDTDTAR
jgi:hypothetical protein